MLALPLPEFVAAFEGATLPRIQWTHEGHLAVALAFCHDEENTECALNRMRAAIRRYNAATGVIDGPMSGYHETLTVFWVRCVSAFQSRRPGQPHEVLPHLLEQWGDKKAPLRFYSKRVLMNPTARARFLEPDLAPFDF